jgi:hypothetical protein
LTTAAGSPLEALLILKVLLPLAKNLPANWQRKREANPTDVQKFDKPGMHNLDKSK